MRKNKTIANIHINHGRPYPLNMLNERILKY